MVTSSDEVSLSLMRNVSNAEKKCRNRREKLWVFREIVGAWLLSHLLPQKLMRWQAGLISIIGRWGVQFDPDHVSEVGGGGGGGKLLVAISLAVCVDFKF